MIQRTRHQARGLFACAVLFATGLAWGQQRAADPGIPTDELEVSPFEPWNELQAIEAMVGEHEGGPANARGRVSVLVHMDPAQDRNQRPVVKAFATARGAVIQHEYEILPNVINIRNFPVAALDALKARPGVAKVEEDYVVTLQHNDSLPLIRGYQSQIQAAGITATGAGIRACVVDTGIDSNSIMYAGRIDTAAGWDFVNNDSNPEDDQGHGSHVAGTVLGGFVNADFACATTGVESLQGVAPSATLIGVKVLNSSGTGSASNIIAGINRCASPTLPGGPADVMNLSLGGGQFTSTCDTDTMAQAVNNAVNAGVVVVAAAGNNGYANALSTPACASGAIAVAAVYDENYPNCDFPNQTSFQFCLDSFCFSTCTDNSPVVDQRVCFSNRSAKIDVAAPGCIIFSDDSTVAAGNGLVGFCGTSQASPHVAGLAALLLDVDPTLTPVEVRQLIRDGAIDKGVTGFDTSYGWGRIDVINSLQLASPGCTTNAECDDGLFCNGAEACNANVCQGGTAPDCADSVACTTDSCNEATDSCNHVANNSACSDGLFCNGSEICNATLGCQAGTAPNCADSVACTNDSCNEATDSCNHVPNNSACNDGLFCNGSESCSMSLGCQGGSDPCPGQSCDELGDVCVGCTTDPECDDASACTVDTCNAGTCSYAGVNCDDANVCTTEGCDPAIGCTHASVSCDDGQSCTTDSCNPLTGCQNSWPACGINDGCCGPGCTSANDPNCCLPRNASCSSNAQCCSGKCRSGRCR